MLWNCIRKVVLALLDFLPRCPADDDDPDQIDKDTHNRQEYTFQVMRNIYDRYCFEHGCKPQHGNCGGTHFLKFASSECSSAMIAFQFEFLFPEVFFPGEIRPMLLLFRAAATEACRHSCSSFFILRLVASHRSVSSRLSTLAAGSKTISNIVRGRKSTA